MNNKNLPPNFFAVIPMKIVQDKTISATGRLLFGCIVSLTRVEGFCYATNSYLAKLLSISARTIPTLLRELEDKKCLKITYEDINTYSGRKIFIQGNISAWGYIEHTKGIVIERGGDENPTPSYIIEKENIINNAFCQAKAYFCKVFQEKNQSKYDFNGGKDGNCLKRFLAKHPEIDFENLVDWYFSSPKSSAYPTLSTCLSSDTINKYNIQNNEKINELLKWAEERREKIFLDRQEQLTAICTMKNGKISPERIKEKWIEMENNDFWRNKGFDFNNLIKEFDKENA